MKFGHFSNVFFSSTNRIPIQNTDTDLESEAVFRIHISFHVDPGSQKCPYGSGFGSRPLLFNFYSDPDPDPRGVKIKKYN